MKIEHCSNDATMSFYIIVTSREVTPITNFRPEGLCFLGVSPRCRSQRNKKKYIPRCYFIFSLLYTANVTFLFFF